MLRREIYHLIAVVGLCGMLTACDGATAPAAAPAAAPTSVPAAAPAAAPTSVPAAAPAAAPTSVASSDNPIIQAIYTYLGRGPDQITDEVVVDNVQGPYARVSLQPEFGDGLWVFLQQSQGGWVVINEVSMMAQPDLRVAREKGVPEELLSDIAGPPPPESLPSDTEAPIWARPLSMQTPRLQGDDVLIVQQRLQELGYSEVGAPDGYFGPATDSAVRAFQFNNNLDTDGIVGEQTWNRLFSSQATSA